MTKKCKTCAWYCHSDGKCYGGNDSGIPAYENINAYNRNCRYWAFDGLEEWEREETEALMTMEPA